jgi:predicted Na+-dependent transporter
LLVMAVIPIFIGAAVRDRWPTLERQYGRRLRALSAVGVAGIVAIGLLQSAGSLQRMLLSGGAAASALVLAGMVLGWATGVAFRAPVGDRFTLLIEFAVRSLAIAMVVQVTLLRDPAFIAFGAVALFVQAVVLMAAVCVYRSAQGD